MAPDGWDHPSRSSFGDLHFCVETASPSSELLGLTKFQHTTLSSVVDAKSPREFVLPRLTGTFPLWVTLVAVLFAPFCFGVRAMLVGRTLESRRSAGVVLTESLLEAP